ncbi:TonB-dependent receptor [Microbulbifer yueqingensis]|uniref:Outer membrane receptor proteins, mostly Fe transport n=1 Tax=Microbulbifer yueqingensis TaxID=658219 RepID=A0A1G9DMY7_9GAMM|nr:TonB-dependent receptor [Microbulbifer yueqingensis]SDK65214.1 Outer membrane receptor proteins, mostly Fe transport [Microbulbifer yueqingensis]
MKNQAKRSFSKHHLALAITAVSAGYALSVSQAVNAQADDAIEEVIVTATARETSVQDVPYNISAVSGDDISAAQITDQAELMRNVPGVAVVDRGSRNSGVINGIMIRGLNVDSAALGDYSVAAAPTVSTYVNSTPVYANFILKDLERVEILRGPQGTLYGSGSLGGTVRYITRSPDTEGNSVDFSSGVSSTTGSDGLNYSADSVVNLALSDTLAIRAAAGLVDNAGVVDYVNVYRLDNSGIPVAPEGVLSPEAEYRTVEDADTVEITYARFAALWQPTDDFEVLFTHMTQEDEIGGRRQQTEGLDGWGNAYDDYENGSIQLEPSSREASLNSLEAEIDLGFATLTSSSSDYDHSGDSVSENTGFYAQNGWIGAFYYNYNRPMASAVRQYEDSAFIQELRLVSNGTDSLDWILGAFYIDQDTAGAQQSYLRGYQQWADAAWGAGIVASDQDWDYARDDNFTETAFYGELTWHLDALHLTLGARQFSNEYESAVYMDFPAYGSGAIFPVLNDSRVTEDDGLLFKANAAYDISADMMAYATISEGYRRGGSNAAPTSGFFGEDPSWAEYEADTVVNYEAGIKGSVGSMTYTAAAFAVEWDNVQVNTATPYWGFFAVTNGEAASTSGIELELSGDLSQDLGYSLGYAYVNAELDSDLTAPGRSAPLASAGTRLPGTPENTLTAALDYRAPLGNGGLEMIGRMAAYYQSSTMNAASDSQTYAAELDGFSLLDGHIGVAGEWWTATLFAKNLTNEEGTTGLFKEEYMGTDPSQQYYGNGAKSFLVQPRTIGANLKLSF